MHVVSRFAGHAGQPDRIDSVADRARCVEVHELDGPDGGPNPSSYARCSDGAGTLAHLFFSGHDEELARAKAICRTCGLAEDCLRGAIERVEVYGVWGGKLVLDGVPVEFKPRRGRPRKRPEPILVVDEIPQPNWVA